MIAQRGYAFWAGWGGTALFLVSWLAIARISALSFPLWIGLMLSGAILCFYGGAHHSKWFLVPGFAAVIVTAGVLAGVYLAGQTAARLSGMDGHRLHGTYVFMWLLMLAPKSMKSLLPIFDKIGPFFWLVPLATIVFPVIAAKRGSKCWWAVTATALITFVVFLRMALD